MTVNLRVSLTEKQREENKELNLKCLCSVSDLVRDNKTFAAGNAIMCQCLQSISGVTRAPEFEMGKPHLRALSLIIYSSSYFILNSFTAGHHR